MARIKLGFKGLILKDGSNDKIDKTEEIHDSVTIYTVSLPVRITCPCAKYCIAGCYASTGNSNYSSVKNSDNTTYELSKQPDFIDIANKEIRSISKRLANMYVRLHVRGDFYNVDYAKKWVKIAEDNPNVKFYAYTKSVSIIKSLGKLPDNLIIAFSYGGKEDNLIDPKKDKHVIVIENSDKLPKGYVLCGDDDLTMFEHDKIAIVYHGTKKFVNTDWSKVELPKVE